MASGLLALADIPENVVQWQPAQALSAVVALGALWWRRTHPVMTVVAGFLSLALVQAGSGVVGAPTQATTGHIMVLGGLVAALARWAPTRGVAIGVGAGGALAVIGTALSASPGWAQLWIDAITWAGFGAGGAALRYRAALQLVTAERIRLDERNRIARDLHDTVAHHVSAMAIQAEGARALLATRPEAAGEALTAIHRTASTALDEMRTLVGVLRHPEAPDTGPGSGGSSAHGSTPGLGDLAGLARIEPSLPVTISVAGDLEDVPAAAATTTFRIVQESLSNVRRHAPEASRVEVVVARQGDDLEVMVSNEGSTYRMRPGAGYGLVGMHERATLLGGSLTAGPGRPGQWVVRATLPLGVSVS